MKKILSVVLAFCLVFGMFAMTASATDGDLIVTVANDIHYNSHYTSKNTGKHNSVNADFAHVLSDDKMTHEGLAVISAFLEAAGTNESDYVIFPGDLADRGIKEEAYKVASMFREFEAKYG
ncbi:MAG: metallophosphoesterase [Clostridia bacterium]|nr:metallophosphoesterase [Clostridia bacterium]